MEERVGRKAKQILEGLRDGHFETAKDWSPDTKEDYYLYFNDPDYETRKLAILVFAAAVGNSRRGVARIILSDKKIVDSKTSGSEDKSRFAYSFEKYLNAFLNSKEAIKNEFPALYKVILAELKLWHDETPFFILFLDVDKALLNQVVEEIKDVHVRNSDLFLDPVLDEVEWPPYK